MVQPAVPVYRVALLSHLSRFEDIDITCFHSRGCRYGAVSVGTDLPVDNEMVPSLYLTSHGGPVYQCLISRIIRGKFDVVICYQNINNISTLLLWLLRKFFRYRFLWWGTGFDTSRQKSPYSKPRGFLNKIAFSTKNFTADLEIEPNFRADSSCC